MSRLSRQEREEMEQREWNNYGSKVDPEKYHDSINPPGEWPRVPFKIQQTYAGEHQVTPEIDDVVEFENPQLANQGTVGIVTGMVPVESLEIIVPEWENKQPGEPPVRHWYTQTRYARLVWRSGMRTKKKDRRHNVRSRPSGMSGTR